MIPAYKGDESFAKKLTSAGVNRPFAEIRAIVMRDVWNLEMIQPSRTIEEALGRDVLDNLPDEEAARQLFGQYMALWNNMADHQTANPPFRFFYAGATTTATDLASRAMSRIVESEILSSLLYRSNEAFTNEYGKEFRDEACRVYEGAIDELRVIAKALNVEGPDLATFEAKVTALESQLEDIFNICGKNLALLRRKHMGLGESLPRRASSTPNSRRNLRKMAAKAATLK